MADATEKTRQTLSDLGISAPEQIAPLFDTLDRTFSTELSATTDSAAWQALRDRWQSRKQGILTHVKQNWLQPAPPDLKREVGKQMNALRQRVESGLAERKTQIESGARGSATEAPDLTLPGLASSQGARHILTQTMAEITGIFERIGFSVVEGPEVETLYYNFTALNIPEDHPAVDEMDSLYVEAKNAAGDPLLLRTHTSPMQIRTMEKQKPPVRIVVPGKVYRRDNPDATHSFMFHQVEGLAVDTNITFADLKGSLEFFLREFFGPEMKPELFPLHRALGRRLRLLRVLRGERLPRLQTDRLD
jgi:phenylalanyl-tRNA synthetase alpha chain